MSIIAIGSRILRRQRSLFGVRYVKYERPVLRFGKQGSLVSNRQDQMKEEEYTGTKDDDASFIKYVLLGVPVVTFILGSWQIERRKWKLDIIDDLKAKTSSPLQPLPEDLNELKEMNYCRVKVRGEFLYDREFSIGPKSLIKDGAGASENRSALISNRNNTGYNLITPFKVENRDTIILVNRGWIPVKAKQLPREKLGHVPGIIEINGIVRLTEERAAFTPRNTPTAGVWPHRDVEAMAYMHNTDPVFLDLLPTTAPPDGPIAGQTRITLRNEHLTYIITWYSLSIITMYMWHRLFIRKLPLL